MKGFEPEWACLEDLGPNWAYCKILGSNRLIGPNGPVIGLWCSNKHIGLSLGSSGSVMETLRVLGLTGFVEMCLGPNGLKWAR